MWPLQMLALVRQSLLQPFPLVRYFRMDATRNLQTDAPFCVFIAISRSQLARM